MTAEAVATAPRDPYAGFRDGLGISGQPIPIIGTTGCEVLDAAPEGVLVRLPVTQALIGQDGRLLPGAIGIVADVACGWAAHAAQQHAGFASTAQLRLEFVRPLPALGAAVVVRATCDSATAEAGLARGEIILLTCTASVAHRGRRFVVAEGHLVTADGRIAARVSCGAQVRTAGTGIGPATQSSTERP